MKPGSQRLPPDLEARFMRLVEGLGLAGRVDDVSGDLAARYAAPGRHFHTLAHVRDCLQRLDPIRYLLLDPVAAELALWFHDAVHEPGRNDNELHSALLFDRQLGIHLPTRRADAIHALIMVTRHDGDAGGGGDADYVADIDLAGLAAPRSEFLREAALLRRERGHGAAGGSAIQAQFLSELLSRPAIYVTEYFRSRCEAQARDNIEALIAGGAA